jgi:LacI family transcriptional regulator
MHGLLTGSSGMVGVVTPYVDNTFMSALLEGIVEALWEQAIVPLVLCSHLDVQREEKAIHALAAKRVDGLIIVPSREDRGQAHFMRLLENHTPIITVDSPLPEINAPHIASDDEKGAVEATRHLLERGHASILYLTGALDSKHADRRREYGYQKVMQAAGLKPRVIYAPGRIAHLDQVVPLLDAFFASEAGRETTAVFCANDSFAYCVYASAARQGRNVGEDLAVMGFGLDESKSSGEPRTTDILLPRLSSVDQHQRQWGQKIVDILRRTTEGEAVAKQTLIEPTLVIRDSSNWAWDGNG